MKNLSNYNFIIITILVFSSCARNEDSYTLINHGDGIFVENFGILITDENRYTQNNTVYQEGNNYTFNYTHLTRKGDNLLFDLQFGTEKWEFCTKQNSCDTTIHILEMFVLKGLGPLREIIPDYNQTVLQYDYLNRKNSDWLQEEFTGVIDNEKNIWMHPPRSGYFKILELNPFPYIQAPYEIGNSWEWSLKIGSHWRDERWKIWKNGLEHFYKYEITDISKKPTAFGDIECYEITSTGTGKLGETKLVSWFNFNYGFIKLDYTNIDSSKTIIELQEFEKRKPQDY